MLQIKEVLGGEKITIFKNFLSKEECEEFIKYFDSAENHWAPTCFYGAYGMAISTPLTLHDNPQSINMDTIDALKEKIILATSEAAGKKTKLNSIHAQKWEAGSYATPHSDNSDLEGNETGWGDNKFSTVLYLNDNYMGGELNFINHDISVKLDAGTLIAFPGGIENIHEVAKIIEGKRYTIVTFQDWEDSWYSEEELLEMEKMILKERIHQYKQKKAWKDGIENPIFEDPYEEPEGWRESLTVYDIKCSARRNQEAWLQSGKLPPK